MEMAARPSGLRALLPGGTQVSSSPGRPAPGSTVCRVPRRQPPSPSQHLPLFPGWVSLPRHGLLPARPCPPSIARRPVAHGKWGPGLEEGALWVAPGLPLAAGLCGGSVDLWTPGAVRQGPLFAQRTFLSRAWSYCNLCSWVLSTLKIKVILPTKVGLYRNSKELQSWTSKP